MFYKRKVRIIVILIFLLCQTSVVFAETLHIGTPSTSMVLDATSGKPLKFLYYGVSLDSMDIANLPHAGGREFDAYPAYGIWPTGEYAISAIHADGNMTTRLVVEKVDEDISGDGTILTTVSMSDEVYPFSVDVKYRTYKDSDVLETWAEIKSNETHTKLTRYMSAYLPIRRCDAHLVQFYGSWGNEARVEEAPLPHGIKVIKSANGSTASHTALSSVMISLDGKARENDGRIIAATLCYGGNYKLLFNSDDSDYHHFYAGISEDNASYNMKKGEKFITPVLALTYTENGVGQASRNFHRWGRNHRLPHGNMMRDILLNSWEGVYFDIREENMFRMMKDFSDIGGELFVMDDGWFGRKYRRNNDGSALGDWYVDTSKLPHGIAGLCGAANSCGLKFGIWIEPEFTNTASEFYECHPEYVISTKNRPLTTGRGGTQLVLDMGNPEVQNFVYSMVDTLLTSYPHIAYIKWDANACIMEHGSQYQTADNQSHLVVDYHKGLNSVLERLRSKYPGITMQACSGGGARTNWDYLKYFDEFWTSDNTDALQRIYIQWGTSYFFPACAMAAHISASPNHQTNRLISLKFRTDVAMSGRLGLEMQPKDMTEAEKEQTRMAIEDYKRIRPIVQLGELYRLLSPFDHKGAASLMYVTEDKKNAVFYWYKTESFINQQLPRIKMSGLDPDRQYTVTELNRIDTTALPYEGKSYSGRFLMSDGLEIPFTHNTNEANRSSFASRVLLLESK